MKNYTWLQKAVQKELSCLWGDLYEARNAAVNGEWSVKCDHLIGRIRELTLLVGPTPWSEIEASLLESGVYQRFHAELGICVSPDMDDVKRARRRSEERLAAIRAADSTRKIRNET